MKSRIIKKKGRMITRYIIIGSGVTIINIVSERYYFELYCWCWSGMAIKVHQGRLKLTGPDYVI